MELILMRHGKAEERGSRPTDEERELTEKGREKAEAAAKGLAGMIKRDAPVTIWTSPITRARQTAEIVACEIKGAEIAAKEALVHGDLEALHRDLQEFDREGTLILVGHEPYLSHWGARIAGAVLPLKPAAAMAIEMSSAVPPEGDILWFAQGPALRRMANREKSAIKNKPGKK